MRYEKVSRKVQEKSYEAERYIIHLLNCALHDKIPENKPEKCSWKMLYAIAKKNNVENCISPAINNYCGKIPGEIIESWKQEKDNTLYRQLCFEIEREQILRGMEENGISYLLLKGILIANYYPAPGMRWFCDNDILYGYVHKNAKGGYEPKGDSQQEQEYWKQQAQKELCAVMQSMGYAVKNLKGSHDVYQKSPFFNFEMHHKLVPEDSGLAEYYRNPWKRAISVEEHLSGEYLVNDELTANIPVQFRFTDEDEYLYFVAHAYKHFDNSGCGIRTLVDEYVILQKKENLDWEYIDRELSQMKLVQFEHKLRRTALHAFGVENQLQQEERRMIYYMLGCGTYGTSVNRVKRKLSKIDGANVSEIRRKYLKERFGLDEEKMKDFFPFFYKHKSLRILLPLYRLGKGMLVHPGRLLEEWRTVRRYTKDGSWLKIWQRSKKDL